MNSFKDAFISYGRADSRDFAAKLNQRLIEIGLEVWFDIEDIPGGVDYQKQIDDGINKAHNFLFVISPHAVNSPHCAIELELALKQGKRIIPLMHVEEISYTTWQQRNPDAPPGKWRIYRAERKHSSFANMHPAIKKINWVYCREGVDDFEQSLQNLLDIFKRDQHYVHHHTVLLDQALTWELKHKPVDDLLGEAQLQKAKAWLQTRFHDHQPPCAPTKLQCQFITESLKNANSGMTQIFLSHAEEDRDAQEIIYELLIKQGLTIWKSGQDIQTGVDFKAAIKRGIEAADNVIYLLSPDALRSPWCQDELDYALSLNKRIIPVLIKPVDLDALPNELQALQFIDLTNPMQASGDCLNESDLLKVLQQDAGYYKDHKLLLVKALKWQRQLRNPCILLRSHALRQAETWLKVAQKHARHRPLPIQAEFIQTSLKQPLDVRLNVFIASTSRDLEFARKLNETLQIQEESTWFEPDKTALGPDYAKQVREGIERAENFIFIVSHYALADPALLEELKIAEALSKRIIAVSYQPFDRAELPPALVHSPWVDLSAHGEDFLSNFGALYRILKSHPQHMRQHTRLLIRALEWQQSGHHDSDLLRGNELVRAERWLKQAENQTPKPAYLHFAYLKASRELSSRKVKPRSVLGLSVGATLLVLVVRLFGLLQGLELAAYDHLLRQRPNEAQDDRFLIVIVDDESSSFLRSRLIAGSYQPGIGTIPDDALNKALTVLTKNQARLIGLDFYRDFPASLSLVKTFEDTENLIAVCKSSYEGKGVHKAPEVPIERVGFSDMVPDLYDGSTFVRRHYLMQGADSEFCETSTSLSLSLANRYLQAEGITYASPAKPEGGFKSNGLKLGGIVVPNLYLLRGPYYPHAMDLTIFGGYQTLLNFRTAPNPQTGAKDPGRFAPVVSLKDILTEAVPSDLIADRIVLIGYTDYADRNADYWETPFGEMAGVLVQGQMTSQLISAVLDGRSLIRWWPFGGEVLWIFGWAVAGGVIVRQVFRLHRLPTAVPIGMGLLYGSCYGAMVYGSIWIPLAPPCAAFVLTAGGVAMLYYRLRNL
ncbi:MAG: TIR domain-containing protein [Leptolyngbyaceae cyanobacterium MO_188.B28]|nr:TIR domain-containing protein [Leptolyngbyaceae cyanobacterium MO_188.B28]